MKNFSWRCVLVLIAFYSSVTLYGNENPNINGILYSRIGYDLNSIKHIMVRSTSDKFIDHKMWYEIKNELGKRILKGKLINKGIKWKSAWWLIDFSNLNQEGIFTCEVFNSEGTILRTESFEVRHNLLWDKTWKTVSLEQLEGRIKLRNKNIEKYSAEYAEGGGWQDCGSYLREVNSHVTMLVGLFDLLELVEENIQKEDRVELQKQIIIGVDYLAFCQEQGKALGKGDGAIIHEHPKHNTVITGDVAKGAMAFARASALLKDDYQDKANEYHERAIRSFDWLNENGPVHYPGGWDFNGVVQPNDGFDPIPYGASENFVRPEEWKTRDLVMMMWAALELYKSGSEEYKEQAVKFASFITERQIPIDKPEGRFYGHFKTFKSTDITEKAWEHHHMGFDAGSTFPHYLVPLMQMYQLLNNHKDAAVWDRVIRNFAYGYFLPACSNNPFLLLPMGYFEGEGLLEFSGMWHGINGAYGSAAALALELFNYTGDIQFKEIATSNLQWIAGLNSGIKEDNKWVSKSMIYAIGDEYIGSWTKIPGTICNGFEADQQFKFAKPTAKTDGPFVFTDEGWITHSGGWLSAISRLVIYK